MTVHHDLDQQRHDTDHEVLPAEVESRYPLAATNRDLGDPTTHRTRASAGCNIQVETSPDGAESGNSPTPACDPCLRGNDSPRQRRAAIQHVETEPSGVRLACVRAGDESAPDQGRNETVRCLNTEYIRDLVEHAPPLSDEQRSRLGRILRFDSTPPTRRGC